MKRKNGLVQRGGKYLIMIFVLVLLAFALWYGQAASAPSTPQNDTPYVNGRFGFGYAGNAPLEDAQNLASYLNAGWYWDWTARGETRIPPLTYIQTISLSPIKEGSTQVGYTASPTGTTLINRVRANPGAIWLIGNEPDCNTLNNMHSEFYAYAYHDLYHLIKNEDPTAKIGAGNIVQPTPLRINYLERVLDTYEQRYQEPLVADFWSIHSYILCENCYPYAPAGEPFAWGACYVPDWPYQHAPDATFYSVYDHWDVDIFAQRIINFRQWMYDHGYRNHPLIIPEYGTLFYDSLMIGTLGLDPVETNVTFMNAVFDWMREARDPVLGYAPDDHRLVQRWAWFSLDHGDYPGGALFDKTGGVWVSTYLGDAYAEYTADVTPAVDLHILDFEVDPLKMTQDTLTVTLNITVANAGNIKTQTPPMLSAYIDSTIIQPITQTSMPNNLDCCGDYDTTSVVVATDLVNSNYDFCVDVLSGTTPVDTACAPFGVSLELSNVWGPTIFTSTMQLITATLNATVINTGMIPTWEPITVSFFITGTSIIPIDSVPVDQLDSMEATTVSVPWPGLSDGVYFFCAVATTGQMQTEPMCSNVWINPPHNLHFPLIFRTTKD